ncbi:MAG: MOSC domain-containing protein [candidate division Zixibacteria bacterium]
MTSAGKIHRISISKNKGGKKKNVESAHLIMDKGMEGDAHFGSKRQVSLLPLESFVKVKHELLNVQPGDFAENITTAGIDLSRVQIGDTVTIGKGIKLIITQIGKKCHNGCQIKKLVGDCIMPREGVFARVVESGEISVGDTVALE